MVHVTFFSLHTLGPFNVSYRNFNNHLLLSGLEALLSADSRNPVDAVVDFWGVLWDLTACIEAVGSAGSPAGYAVDAAAVASALSLSLPQPDAQVASILPPDKFSFVAIPNRTENQSPSVSCCIC